MPRAYTDEQFRTKFFARISQPEYGCRLWLGCLDSRSLYGVVKYRGRQRSAHAVALILATGQDPAGMCAMHSCDNPRCCAPEHLRWGTNQENMADKVSKGRQSRGAKHRAAIGDRDDMRGVNNYQTHLREQDVLALRERVGRGEKTRVLAKELHVSYSTIYSIVHRRTWVHI